MTSAVGIPPTSTPAFSSLQKLVSDARYLSNTAPAHLQTLAWQIKHNLQYQHSWSALHIHTHSPITNLPLPRPLISGLPATRLYVHPEEQIELLKEAERQRRAAARVANTEAADSEATESQEIGLEVKPEPEREWVLPTRLSEKWTMKRLSEVFDGVGVVPPHSEDSQNDENDSTNKWRTTKRLVLATVDTDSTVVYYIIHDGVVKPRQN